MLSLKQVCRKTQHEFKRTFREPTGDVYEAKAPLFPVTFDEVKNRIQDVCRGRYPCLWQADHEIRENGFYSAKQKGRAYQ